MDTTVADTEVTGSGAAAKPASAGKTSAAVEKHTVPGEKPPCRPPTKGWATTSSTPC
ncbi:hypothetical protein PJ267_02115 [Arthrobacter sp. OVS8]|nr:hypothetical protein PJ267_02115 [Arthrobacter sp. OVS8]